MSRSIKLYWDINNDAIDEAVRKFDVLQKKVEEMNAKASQMKTEFSTIDEGQAAALDAEYKKLKIKEKELSIEEKKLRLAQQKEKIERQSAKVQEESAKKAQDYKRKLSEQEEKEAQKRIREAEKLAQRQQKEQEKLHKAAEAERKREEAHMAKLASMRQKASAGGGGGGGGGAISMPSIGGDGGGGMLGNLTSMAGGYGAALQQAGKMAAELAKQLYNVYATVLSAAAETQRLETNLALAFQSASVAGKGFDENLKVAESAMLRIQELAAQTPFDVNQLTDAYIKLTKRGMRPAEEQLLAIGNLASFSGKSIDQLTEAILDAQQGNKVRLKEFGIEMQVESGKVKLAIGDIAVEGEKIIETFSKLGEMPGISEAMIKQSETLGGMFDTLKDTWGQFLAQVGRTPSLFNTVKSAAGGISIFMEALKKSAFAFGNALGEPLQILVKSIFPNFNTQSGGVVKVIDSITLQFVRFADMVKLILKPMFQFLADAWESIRKHIIDNENVIEWLKTAYRGFAIFLGQLWDALKAVVDMLAQVIGNLFDMGAAAQGGISGIRNFSAAVLATIDIVKDLIIELAALIKLLFSFANIGFSWVTGGAIGMFKAIKKETPNIQKSLNEIKFNFFNPKTFKDNYEKYVKALAKETNKLPVIPKGLLPGGADLAPTTGADTKAKKEALVREKEHLQKMEKEKRRHVQAVIAIEEEAVRNKELNETKARQLAEEAIIHEEKTFEEKEQFAKDEYEMKRRLTIANVRNGKQEAIDLEFLDQQYQNDKEKRQFEHENKILELTHKSNQAKYAEHQAFVAMSRRLEERRLDDSLNDLKRSLEAERELIQLNAQKYYAQSNATNLKILEIDKKQAEAEYATQKKKLEDKLFDNGKFGNLTREQELIIKADLEKLERDHQHKLTQFVTKGEKERLEIQRYLAQSRKKIVEEIIADAEDALKKGLGENFGGAVMNIATIKKNLKDMREAAQKEIAALRSIGTSEANNMADILEKKLGKDSMKMVANQIGQAISNVIAGVNDIMNKIQELRIAQIDKQIQKNNEELEQLREKAELEKQRNDELLRRQEIDNKLAKQRIDELTQLQTSIPESEQALAEEQIEIQKRRIKDIEKAKEDSDKKENARVKQIEAENKRLEEEKKRVQREQFEINRAAQIAQTIISGALAAINAFASLSLIPIAGPGLGAAAAATIGVFTAAQVGLIAAQPNPYAKGTLNVEGNIKNKDSVHAILTPGEAVIPVRENRDYHEAIKAIYNREISPKEMNAIVKNVRAKRWDMDGYSGGSSVVINQLDHKPIVEAINNKPVASVNIDQDGLEVYINTVSTKTKILNKKLRVK